MKQREQWGSNIGFIMASIGSAVGLGNIWRFPYIVGENGGGAFLVPYVIITICFGLAFMLLEFAVGRKYQTSIISCIGIIKKRLRWAGVFIVLVSFAILSYYMVILGWVFSFFVLMLSTGKANFDEYTNSLYPLLSFVIVLGFNYVILRKGITRGIEKFNKIGVLLLAAILVPLVIYAMSLPDADKGISYYLTPDFDKLYEPSIWSTAFGQVFFSLSIGSGILLAYASYLKSKTSLIKSSSIIIVSNGMFSFVAGLMIFSIVFSFGMDPESGPTLVFEVLPSIFGSMEFGVIFGIAFFFLILIAGLTSSVSIFQVQVSALEDTLHFSKAKSVNINTILVLVVGFFSALSYSSIGLTLSGKPFLDLMDDFFGTYGLPIASVALVIIITWFMEKKQLIKQINQYSRIRIPENLIILVRFVLPAVIIVSIVFTIFAD